MEIETIHLLWPVLNTFIKSPMFWDKTSCSPLKVNRIFRGTCRLHLQGCGVSQARNHHGAGAALKIEAICSSDMSVDFQRITRRYKKNIYI
jgi:hypothetical protein